MAGVKISALPVSPAATLDDILAIVQGGITKQETLAQVVTLMNSSIQLMSPSQITGLAAALAAYLPLAGGMMSGNLILNADATSPLQAVTLQQLQAIGQGFTVVLQCQAATTANLTATYNNGASGVGATLTNSGTQAAFAVDGYSANVNDRILVKNQTSTANNGIYTVTTVGSGASNWVLTRAADYDQGPSEIFPGTLVLVIQGTSNANTSWLETATVTTVGTNPILFAQFSGAPSAAFQVANNLSEGVPSTMRTNLGLGTAAVKNVSNNADAVVASVNGSPGSFTPGNFATFSDTNGSIQDGGSGSGFLVAANNLSDLANIPTANLNLFNIRNISGNNVLTSADYGRVTRVTGSGAAAITLPSLVANQYLQFTFQMTGGALATLTPASGLIDGQPNKIYGAGEGCFLFSDGVNLYTMSERLQPVSFRAYNATAQVLSPSVITKIQASTVVFNVGGYYDSSVNFRFNPKYPGKYQVTALATISFSGTTDFGQVFIYKNGAVDSQAIGISFNGVSNLSGTPVTTVIAMNGTTDYLEMFAQQGSSINRSLANTPNQNFFTAVRISNY